MSLRFLALTALFAFQFHHIQSPNHDGLRGLPSISEGKEWSRVAYILKEDGWAWDATRRSDRYVFIIEKKKFKSLQLAKKFFEKVDFGGQHSPQRGSYTGRRLGDGSWFAGTAPYDSISGCELLVISGQEIYGARLNVPAPKTLEDAKPIPMSQRKFLEDLVLEVINSQPKP